MSPQHALCESTFRRARAMATILTAATITLLVVAGCATSQSSRKSQRYENLLVAAKQAMNSSRPDLALLDLKEAIQLSQRDFRAHMLSGVAYEMLHDYDEAIQALLAARSLAPGVKQIPFNLGNNYFALKQYSSAVDAYSQAIAVDPTFSKPYLNRANALVNLGDYRSALRDYRRYQELISVPRADVAQMISRLDAYVVAHPAETQ